MSDAVVRLNVALKSRYRIERELGEGGMAAVYLADDLKHERKVALKVLKPARSSARTRFTAMAVLAGCTTVSCFGPFEPCAEWREVRANAQGDFTATAAADGSVSLKDDRNDDDSHFLWFVSYATTDAADPLVTDSHLHEAETDDVLYSFPVSVERAPVERAQPADPTWFHWDVSSGISRGELVSGQAVPFDLLYGLVSSGGTYLDVHTVAHPAGVRAPLAINVSTNWIQDCDGD